MSEESFQVTVTTFDSVWATVAHEERLTLHVLADRIVGTSASDQAHLKLALFGKTRTPFTKKPDGTWIGGCLRHDDNVQGITGIEGDYDQERIAFQTACEIAQHSGLLAIVYTSPSHTDDTPRWRVLCPLSVAYPPEDRDRFMARLNGLYGGVFSGESWTLSQSYYYGSVNDNPSHRVEVIDGTPINLLVELDAGAIGKPAKPPPTVLDLALDIAARGFPVFPCRANKKPAFPKAKGGNGFRDASTDPDRIRELWDLAGPAVQLIGVPTGHASGFDVLDIDPRHGGDRWKIEHSDRLGETRIHSTPGLPKVPTDPVMPGEHWLFVHVDGVRNIQDGKTIAPGIDVRGQGGYVCFPPSDGYRVIHEADIAEWPDWLLPLVLKASEPAPRPEPSSYATPAKISDNRLRGFIDREVRRVRDAPVGARHGARLSAARSIGGVAAEAGLSDTEVEEMLIAARPPEVEEEKERRTIRAGLAYGRTEPIDLNTLPDSAQFRGYRQRGNGAAPPDDPKPQPDELEPEPGDPRPEPPPYPMPGDGPQPRLDEPAELPTILCAAGRLDWMYREAEAALLIAGTPIYQRTMLVKPTVVEYDAAPPSGSTEPRKTHSTALIAVTAPALTKLLSQVAIFMKFDARKKTHVVCDPPPKLVDIILASRGDWAFPVVRGVLTTPTLRPDGSLLTNPGYDPVSRYYLSFPSNLVVPEIPDQPTKAEAEEALARLDSLLDGYDFVRDDGVSRSVALAMLMTQVLRCAMPVSPLLAVSATAPGTGKSHLVDLCSHIAIGRWCPIMNAGKSDEETEKGINTKLISGVPGFSIDNVHRMLDLEALNTATERPLLSPRLFGSLTDIEIENGAVIYQTGNNLAVVGEQRRRTMLCCMDAEKEQPEQRTFTNDPMQAVLANRGRYIADVLIVARAYLTNGSKPNIPSFGSYPEWSRFVREPLCWLGQPDPVLSQKAARENDPEINQRRTVVDAWHLAFGMEAHTLADAVRYATTMPVLPGYDRDDTPDEDAKLAAYLAHKAAQEGLLAALREAFPAGRDGINAHAMGNWMRKFAGRLTDGLKFVKTEGLAHGGIARWKLTR